MIPVNEKIYAFSNEFVQQKTTAQISGNLNISSISQFAYWLISQYKAVQQCKPVTAPRLEVPGMEVNDDVPETGAEADIATAMEPR